MWNGIVKFFVNFMLPGIIENLVLKAENDVRGITRGADRKEFVTNMVNVYLAVKGWNKYFNSSEISELIERKVSKLINF